MEAIKLQSMTDFIESKKPIHAYLQNDSFSAIQTHINETYDLFFKYCDFLKQPLQLGFFVPCDEDGNVLEEPKIEEEYVDEHTTQIFAQYQYDLDRAKENVLFKGFEFKEYERMICFDKKGIGIFIYSKNYQTFSASHGKISTIEDLIIYEFELTETAIKQIGL